MPLNLTTAGGISEVRLSPEDLREPNLRETGAQLLGLSRRSPRPRLRLDFAGVEQLTGSALGELVTLHKRLREAGGQLVLFNLSPELYEVLQVTHLDQLLEVRRSGTIRGVA